jgi:hypothetical protein
MPSNKRNAQRKRQRQALRDQDHAEGPAIPQQPADAPEGPPAAPDRVKCALVGCDNNAFDTRCAGCQKQLCPSCTVECLSHFNAHINFECPFCSSFNHVVYIGGTGAVLQRGGDTMLKPLLVRGSTGLVAVKSLHEHLPDVVLQYNECAGTCSGCRGSKIKVYYSD